ncbi:MAG: riboflavin synthase [Deltaproteobacteria bacterium]|nr:riboflavin synthase [Deltaproteobacteria bacterium]
MFTGLVEGIGEIIEIGQRKNSFQIRIQSPLSITKTEIGASIAVDGVCLTVTTVEGPVFTVDVSPETLKRTTVRDRKRGDAVNLERALRLSDRLGGHLVTGHIDDTGTIKTITKMRNALMVSITTSSEAARYLVEKGSVGVDGISLTINEVQGNTFSVAVIPHTAAMTTIGKKRVGGTVNIETDIIGKYIERFVLQTDKKPTKNEAGHVLDRDFLKTHGFS